ncbi:TetR/AcrR family transcriptional regulator [Paenibacillus arenilitoris]|uniref:TetR/AcrR family transcriptional regulator n=1 Tax=Paenibacillus arenilitoris TaxID=2772299 RepID=A0A927H3R3_9BACL|nr:TetR/AcrR family transcriptional regulator [Paenibacillus arenilitoris]MBD2867616.1 TetR/AcrR family transcriptional regulator [Paenibacillus arenilitoris]
MKQEERREQTTRLLLDSTRALITEKGCQAVTMKDIMERSGLSKGAIFHYVKAKDDIFAWILQERLEETNANFMNEVKRGRTTFDDPMRRIAEHFPSLQDPSEVTNKVLIYLLGKEEQPAVAEALRKFYERSVQLSRQWIATGQEHGVIKESVDPDAAADLFVLLSLGLRVRSTIPDASGPFDAKAYTDFVVRTLQAE